MTQAAAVLTELVGHIETLATPGREWGDAFWRRFDANVGALQTVAARDNYFAQELERAEATAAARP
jgi:hypothetical protein